LRTKTPNDLEAESGGIEFPGFPLEIISYVRYKHVINHRFFMDLRKYHIAPGLLRTEQAGITPVHMGLLFHVFVA
jgi:hypothetical protein